jgi:hypothetical protein
MRKLFISFFIVASFVASAQKKADTVVLKNGQSVAGYIYKMEGNKIYIAKLSDTSVYNASEVQSLMFCHPVRSNEPCSGSSSSYSSNGSSSLSGSSASEGNSYSGSSETKTDSEKGVVIIQCNMCGGKAELFIKGENGKSKTTTRVGTTLANGEVFSHKEKFLPGTYYYTYTDSNKNTATGFFTIEAGEEKKIILFEKQ